MITIVLLDITMYIKWWLYHCNNNFYNEINAFKKNNKVMFIYNDDKEFFRKCIEIWDKIIELIGINNHIYFLKADDGRCTQKYKLCYWR